MNYILFDGEERANLLPFTHTRAVADIRCGILTMGERWEAALGSPVSILTQEYLQPIYGTVPAYGTCYVNAAVFGTDVLAASVRELKAGEKLVRDGVLIAMRHTGPIENPGSISKVAGPLVSRSYEGDFYALNNSWDIFSLNDRAIRDDFSRKRTSGTSAPIPAGVTVVSHGNLFIEEGAKIYAGCIINASTGPVYIGKDAEILEGTVMRGPIAVCDQAVVKMAAKLYGATTIGPGCKVGGEVNNVVFFAHSNKSHDGYLGNAVIGEWCNLGADTNCSNLKNDYGIVKVWHEASDKEISTGLTFCGLMMGDHSKCGINTMFNTGTVVGVSCNIFGGGFPSKYIPSFSWGGSEGFTEYRIDKAIDTANRMMARRGKAMSEAEKNAWAYLFATRNAS